MGSEAGREGSGRLRSTPFAIHRRHRATPPTARRRSPRGGSGVRPWIGPPRALVVGRALMGPVINATGVLLHTNLGRAPIGFEQSPRYTNLELDLETGGRGRRAEALAVALARACGAEAAMVVNNGQRL